MATLDTILTNSEDIDLSGADILRITDGKCKVIAYEDLEGIDRIDQLLEPYGAVVILYETRHNYGHWVCLLKTGESSLEFFDPYALTIDQELNLDNELHLRHHQGAIAPHLSTLIASSNFHVVSNTTRVQEFAEHVNTCGRHVAVRIRFRNLNLKQYIRMITGTKHNNPDYAVSALTLLV